MEEPHPETAGVDREGVAAAAVVTTPVFAWNRPAAWLVAALVLAVLCNGAAGYLKRIGWAHAPAYATYWSIHCADLESAAADEWQCSALSTPAEIARQAARGEARGTGYDHVYAAETVSERALKLAKDVFWIVLVASAVWWRGRLGEAPRPAALRPFAPLVGYVIAALVLSLAVHGPLVAATGVRAFLFLALAMAATGAGVPMAAWARTFVLLLVIEAALAPAEILLGMHLFGEWGASWALRVAGTLVAPNSFGVFVAAAAAFVAAFGQSRIVFRYGLVLAVVLAFLSGSATGLLALAMLAAMDFAGRRSGGFSIRALALSALGAILLIVLLPTLTGRADLFESVSGMRLDSLRAVFADHAPWQILFGRGLGVNTNAALNLAALQAPGGTAPAPTDSLVTGLLVQVGAAGTLLFYGTWARLAWRDPQSRPFHAVAALCSLTMNVTELFPVNVMLGLAWGHGIRAGVARPPQVSAHAA